MSYADFKNGVYELTGLVPGTYTVTETNAEGLITSYTLETESITEGTVEVTEEGTAAIRLANIYKEKRGALRIVKTFSGVPEDADLDDLCFRITGPYGFSQLVTYAYFTDGEYILTDLPLGVYTVTETNMDVLLYAMGEPLDATVYTAYLKEKYSALYGL